MSAVDQMVAPLEPKFFLREEFFDLMKTVGAPERTLTLKQVLAFLKNYITSRKLFNPYDPKEIRVADDPLAAVFGTPTFTVFEVIKLLRMQMFRIPESGPTAGPVANAAPGDYVASSAASCSVPGGSLATDRPDLVDKRKCENLETAAAGSSNENKRAKVQMPSPMVLQMPPSPVLMSGNETEYSIQGYETACAKNSSDDLWFLESEEEDNLSNDSFEVEYEVESAASECNNVSDTDSEIEDVMCAALFICKDDSDVPFWGDKSDDEEQDSSDDPELGEGDNWTCGKCGSINRPFSRICLKCWEQRVGWASSRDERHPPRRRNRKQLLRNLSDPGYQSSQSSQLASLEEETTDTPLSQESQSLNEKCQYCMVRYKTGVIVHGKTGHQVCCYKCARKLQSQNKRCPHCRKTIQRVVRNYIV